MVLARELDDAAAHEHAARVADIAEDDVRGRHNRGCGRAARLILARAQPAMRFNDAASIEQPHEGCWRSSRSSSKNPSRSALARACGDCGGGGHADRLRLLLTLSPSWNSLVRTMAGTSLSWLRNPVRKSLNQQQSAPGCGNEAPAVAVKHSKERGVGQLRNVARQDVCVL